MGKKSFMTVCSLIMVTTICFAQNQLSLTNIDVYYIPWNYHTIVSLDKKQFMESPLTKKITICQKDTIEYIYNEYKKTISGQVIGEAEPNIRMLCIINAKDSSIIEFVISRQKYLFSQNKVYERNLKIISMIEAFYQKDINK